jgi:hypothetical protein
LVCALEAGPGGGKRWLCASPRRVIVAQLFREPNRALEQQRRSPLEK